MSAASSSGATLFVSEDDGKRCSGSWGKLCPGLQITGASHGILLSFHSAKLGLFCPLYCKMFVQRRRAHGTTPLPGASCVGLQKKIKKSNSTDREEYHFQESYRTEIPISCLSLSDHIPLAAFQGRKEPLCSWTRARGAARAEQGACGIWQRSTRMVKAAPEIQGLWLQLSLNNGEAFFWSLLPSHSATAGDHPPVIQVLVLRDTA